MLCCAAQVEFMARNNELEALGQPAAAHSQRRLLSKETSDVADGQPGSSKKLPQQQKQAAAQLPSSNSTVRYMPRLSEGCFQLATLAQLPQSRTSPDFAAAAYSLLESSLSRVQDLTGLQTLEQDSKTGEVVAVSLTGTWLCECAPFCPGLGFWAANLYVWANWALLHAAYTAGQALRLLVNLSLFPRCHADCCMRVSAGLCRLDSVGRHGVFGGGAAGRGNLGCPAVRQPQ